MRRKASSHFIYIIRTENFNESHFHYSGRDISVKSGNNKSKDKYQ